MKSNHGPTPRLFVDGNLDGTTVELADHYRHYLRRVLRLRPGDPLVLFNGRGGERQAVVQFLARERATIKLAEARQPLPESPLELSLIQAIAKADAMDLIIQKSTELGVRAIFPVLTDFSVVKLDEERATRRTEHWRKIAQSACEQSGRHYLPSVHPPQRLHDCLVQVPVDHLKIALHRGSDQTFRTMEPGAGMMTKLWLLIGPEGGLSDKDLSCARQAGFRPACLGPRVLRTETAALAGCAIAQARWGDLAT